MIYFEVVTLFPNIIDSYTSESIISRAQKAGNISIRIHNPRDFTTDKHHTVDDRVYGGGPGMLMKIEPLYKTIEHIKSILPESVKNTTKVVLTSPTGQLLTQQFAKAVATNADENDSCYIILCGHYEGLDHRIMEFVDIVLSIGPIILTGGELAALLFIDSVTRLLPGVLSNDKSAEEETQFTLEDGKLVVKNEHPQYTRPEHFEVVKNGQKTTLSVPKQLLEGHHKNIQEFNESERITHEENLVSEEN